MTEFEPNPELVSTNGFTVSKAGNPGLKQENNTSNRRWRRSPRADVLAWRQTEPSHRLNSSAAALESLAGARQPWPL